MYCGRSHVQLKMLQMWPNEGLYVYVAVDACAFAFLEGHEASVVAFSNHVSSLHRVPPGEVSILTTRPVLECDSEKSTM